MLSGILPKAPIVSVEFNLGPNGEAARAGYRITACAATPHQAAFVLSIPTRPVFDETQETLRTSAFPSSHVQARAAWQLQHKTAVRIQCRSQGTVLGVCRMSRPRVCLMASGHYESLLLPCTLGMASQGTCSLQEKWAKDLYISCVAYGRTTV